VCYIIIIKNMEDNMFNNNAISIFSDTITEQKQKQSEASLWDDSVFEDMDTLKNDYSGKAGELFAARLCKQYGIPYVYDEDVVNQEDGTYDITIKNKLVEIKTARVGNCGKNWQHESLRDHGSDYFMFIDVAPTAVYLSIFSSKFDFTKQHPVFGRTPHMRKGSDGIFKLDFGPKSLLKGIKKGLTLKIDSNTVDKTIKEFIKNRIE
jgi:hypothetical protein